MLNRVKCTIIFYRHPLRLRINNYLCLEVNTNGRHNMVKNILSIAFAAALFMTYPLSVQAGQSMEIIENDIQSVSISVSGSVLHVSGANGQVLQVYNVTGVCLMSVKVDSQDKRYELNVPKGCYIVKVGKTVRKISIR